MRQRRTATWKAAKPQANWCSPSREPMTLQAKLTLGSVLLATLIVSFISTVDLGNLMQLEFQSVYERADLVRDLSLAAVKDTLNHVRDVTLREALNDPEL